MPQSLLRPSKPSIQNIPDRSLVSLKIYSPSGLSKRREDLVRYFLKLTEQLERAPTLQELASAFNRGFKTNLNTEGLSRHFKKINASLPAKAKPYIFTLGRPHIVHKEAVGEAFEKFIQKKGNSPTINELMRELKKERIEISEQSAKFIVTELRNESRNKNKWRFSCRKKDLSSTEIQKAYMEVKKVLASLGVSRKPSASEVANRLCKEGHRIKAFALKERVSSKTAPLSISFDPYSDVMPKAVVKCYRDLFIHLRRSPTYRELAKEISARCDKIVSAESVKACARRLNSNRGVKLVFTSAQPTGVYAEDIKKCFKDFEAVNNRAPTLPELITQLKGLSSRVKISSRTLLDKVHKLGFKCFAENQVKESKQEQIKSVFHKLRRAFGRAPLMSELKEKLAESKISLDAKEIRRHICTFRKNLPLSRRIKYLLADPKHIEAKLTRAYSKETKSGTIFPSTSSISERLSWKSAGVLSAIQHTRGSRIEKSKPLLILQENEVAKELTHLIKLNNISDKPGSNSDFISHPPKTLFRLLQKAADLDLAPLETLSNLSEIERSRVFKQYWVLAVIGEFFPETATEEVISLAKGVNSQYHGAFFEVSRGKFHWSVSGFGSVLALAAKSDLLFWSKVRDLPKEIIGTNDTDAAFLKVDSLLQKAAKILGWRPKFDR